MPARKHRWDRIECSATLAAEARQSAASDSECIRDSAVAIECPLRASCSFQRVVGDCGGEDIRPVSCRFKLSLWRYNTDIEIWRPETRAKFAGVGQKSF